ncbi:hypothetical protein M758_UG175900 [Ceratodon purpureus]|nr:hypothetical protein M758_UG175900 [Ceratodon purpureus]
MVRELYQQVDEFVAAEGQLDDITMAALKTVDNITETNRAHDDRSESHLDRTNVANAGDLHNAMVNDVEATDSATGQREQNGGTSHAQDGLEEEVPNDRSSDGEAVGNADHLRNGERTGQHNYPQQYFSAGRLEEERIRDASALEEAMRMLYQSSSTTKLGATVMLVKTPYLLFWEIYHLPK